MCLAILKKEKNVCLTRYDTEKVIGLVLISQQNLREHIW